jgi:predicted nucleic acid-binding protein
MILVDTGYLVALADRKDQHHRTAMAWSVAVKDLLLVHEYVLLETLNALSETSYRRRAHDIVRTVRNSRIFRFVPASATLLDAALAFHLKHLDKHWSLTDCASFVLMHERSISHALAYDQHFEQAGFVAMMRQSPP